MVITAACSRPSEFGLNRTMWGHEALAEVLESSARVRSISRGSAVGRILAEAEIKPHRIKAWPGGQAVPMDVSGMSVGEIYEVTMKAAPREAAKRRLERLLSSNALTKGMYVRMWGDHLIIGRHEAFGPEEKMEADDRLRLTARNASSWGLSVRRHSGRWEKTPFTGTLEELIDVV